MAFSIPEDVVDKVREAADIVEVISDHVTLKQTGKSFKALCPFHPEKTPSFVVSREKQIYHCFGCGAGGNVINFLMQYESVTFPEAVRALAKRYGIPVPRTGPQVGSDVDFAYRLNALAAKVYSAAMSATKEGTQARAYLRSRGIDEATENEFMLGYAPSEGNLLLQEARRYKIDEAKLAALGLAVGSGREMRDLFRRRLIFPIVSAGGRILGFGGRVLDSSQPKYLNSPETRVFRKSNTLYGIHTAKNEIRAEGLAIVVEGYMDVIALHTNGLQNAVASLGTAFTAEQGRSLRRYCDTAVFLYDGDEAGRIATLRACAVAAEADLKTRVTRLPQGQDPDSFVRRSGREALVKLLGDAAHYVDFVLSEGGGEDKEDIVKFALGIISRIRDPIRASLDTKRLADGSGVGQAALTRALAGMAKPKERPAEKGPAEIKDNGLAPCDKIEKSLISILIGFPERAERVFESLSPSDFLDHRMRKIAETILDRRSRGLGCEASALLTVLEDGPTRSLLIDCSVVAHAAGDPERMVSDHILCMKKRMLTRDIELLRKQIRTAENEGDQNLLGTLLARRQELAHELRLLST
ncbi:MAG: DNA primase [Candidatus Eisenbacteria bacterium]